ncbi:hypothetical protein PYCCODRAFT_1440556 [Trametes coccinea BRFM310]|uniref:Uncharacterized protein n=1 Tax=Trametes coccinea (strain BRFM310) TaxID=1353009 RepID=A0A1Y2I9I8_TRAC3|nr:hypothetical protein PYCCODRAFT_1440556 [Trametes coccinea BRFM310]
MGCRPRTFSVLFVPAIGLLLSAVDATPVGDEELEGEEGRERESSGAERLMEAEAPGSADGDAAGSGLRSRPRIP